jgi:hypothetical protein
MYMRNPNHDKTVTFDTLSSTVLPTTDWQDVIYRQAPMVNHELKRQRARPVAPASWQARRCFQDGIAEVEVRLRPARFNLDQALPRECGQVRALTYSRSVNDATRERRLRTSG